MIDHGAGDCGEIGVRDRFGGLRLRLRDWLCNASSGAEIEFSVGREASRRACEVGFLGGDRASGVRSCDLEQRRRHGGVQVPQGYEGILLCAQGTSMCRLYMLPGAPALRG